MRALKPKIFVSYSRKDQAFASELVAALEACEFDPFFDQVDIAIGESWQDRLVALIEQADTLLLLISNQSLSSEVVLWEVAEAARRSKRLVPLIIEDVDMAKVPADLRKLNFCFFAGRPFGIAMKDLAVTLRADIEWLREHTRVGELASRWIARGRPDELLLRGRELQSVRMWAAQRSVSSPPLSDEQSYLIAQSNRAEEEADRATKRRIRRILLLSVAAIVALGGLSFFGMYQWQKAEDAIVLVEEANHELDAQNSELSRINSKLEAGRRLRIMLSQDRAQEHPVEVGAKWLTIAYANESSAAIIEDASNRGTTRTGAPGRGRPVGSGFVVSARALNPSWPESAVFVTASHIMFEPQEGEEPPPVGIARSDAVVRFPASADPYFEARLGRLVYLSPYTTGAGIYELDQLPDEVEVIWRLADNTYLSQLTELYSLSRQFSPEPPIFEGPVVVSYASDLGRDPSLIMMRLAGLLVDGRNGLSDSGTRPSTSLVMTNGTTPGSGGAPIFDSETGELICIHQRKHSQNEHRASSCRWIGDILDELASVPFRSVP